MLDPNTVLTALQPVRDPELQKSLVELNMIRNVAVDGGRVSFDLILTTPACPLREFIADDCRRAVKALPGVTEVNVRIGAETPQQQALPGQAGIKGVKTIVGVTSGKGGVGKSTVATNLAVALAQLGAKVGLLDADIYGPNVPIMLGLEKVELNVVDSPDGEILEPAFNHGVRFVSMGLLIERDRPVILRGPRLDAHIRQFLYRVAWGELDYLIVDLPPGTGDAQMTLAQAVPMTGAVIVTTPQNVALADARRAVRMFEPFNVPVLGVVENMSYFIPPDLPDRRYDIFGSNGGEKIESELGIPLLGCIPLEIPVREGGDRGLPIVIADPESPSATALISISQKVAAKVSVTILGTPK
jgi:ATP-binding protein involved in chromosome partitioning